MIQPPHETDLVVAGGGPAGLAVAIRARQRGMSVRVIDRRRPPIDKACGEGLMPDGAARLAELGVEIPPSRRFPFLGIRYLDGDLVAEARFPGESGFGIRRTALQSAMAERAREVGVDLVWGVTVRGLTDAGLMVGDEVVGGRWIVAADGLHSSVRRAAGLGGRPTLSRRYGITRHFEIPPWSDCVEVYWGDRCEAYVTPVGAREVGVALLWSGAPASFDTLIGMFPALEGRLPRGRAGSASGDRGAGPLECRVRRVTHGRIALVGDASGYIDAITGDGLSAALHQAFALVDAIDRGDLALYERAHRRIGARPDFSTRLLLAVEQRPRLRRRVMAALAGEPAAFSRLLAVHARQSPARDTVGSLGRLAWHVAGGLFGRGRP